MGISLSKVIQEEVKRMKKNKAERYLVTSILVFAAVSNIVAATSQVYVSIISSKVYTQFTIWSTMWFFVLSVVFTLLAYKILSRVYHPRPFLTIYGVMAVVFVTFSLFAVKEIYTSELVYPEHISMDHKGIVVEMSCKSLLQRSVPTQFDRLLCNTTIFNGGSENITRYAFLMDDFTISSLRKADKISFQFPEERCPNITIPPNSSVSCNVEYETGEEGTHKVRFSTTVFTPSGKDQFYSQHYVYLVLKEEDYRTRNYTKYSLFLTIAVALFAISSAIKDVKDIWDGE